MLAWARPRRAPPDAIGTKAPTQDTLPHEPDGAATTAPSVDIALEPSNANSHHPSGWLDSSLELARGLMVIEHPDGIQWPESFDGDVQAGAPAAAG
jgi:hypothetical protein